MRLQLGAPLDIRLTLMLPTMLLSLPGAFVVRKVLGSSLLFAVAAGIPVSFFLVSLAGWLLELLRLTSTLPTLALTVVALSVAIATFLSKLLPDASERANLLEPKKAWLGAALGVTVAALSWGRPQHWITAVPQPSDYVFHGYVASIISRQGSAGPSALVPVDALSEATVQYQFAAHIVAGVIPGSGLDATASGLNATLWAASTVFLPFGMAAVAHFLSRGRSHAAVLIAPMVVIAAPDSFFAQLGLYSFAVSLATLPGTLLLVLKILKRPHWRLVVLLALALAGQALTHPQMAIATGTCAAVLIAAQMLTATSWNAVHWRALLASAGAAVLGGVIHLPWYVLGRGVDESADLASDLAMGDKLRQPVFDGVFSLLEAVFSGQTLSSAGAMPFNPLHGVVLVGAGVILLVARQHWTVLAMTVTFGIITVVTAVGGQRLRPMIGGVWIGDWYRPAAITAVLAALVIGLAAATIASELSPRLKPLQLAVALPRFAMAVLAVMVLVSVGSNRSYVQNTYRGGWYGNSADTTVREAPLSPLEAEALDELASITPESTRVLNWYGDGSPWMYAAHGLVPTQTWGVIAHDYGRSLVAAEAVAEPQLSDEGRQALLNLKVCTAFVAKGYVDRNPPGWLGEQNIAGFELAFRNDHARVYRVSDPLLVEACT